MDLQVGKRDLVLIRNLGAVVPRNHLVPLLARFAHVRLSRRRHITGWLRCSCCDRLGRGSANTDADVVAQPERLAVASDSRVPLVEVLQSEGAVLVDDSLALITGHNLVVALTVRGDAVLDWSRCVGCRRRGRSSGGFGSRCSCYTNADIVVEPEAAARVAYGRIPLVEIL